MKWLKMLLCMHYWRCDIYAGAVDDGKETWVCCKCGKRITTKYPPVSFM
jgi:hypothetical protein